MTYRQDIEACLGDGPERLSPAMFEAALAETAGAMAKLSEACEAGALPALTIVRGNEDLEDLEAVAQRISVGYDHVVVLGTGGSSLGGQTLYALADCGFGPPRKALLRGIPTVHFVDNVDPGTLESMLDHLPLQSTCFLAISKSGGTAETLAQFLVVLEALDGAMSDSLAKKHMIVVTQPEPSPLRRMAEHWDMTILDHDPRVGGRFSALSLVGLMPAMIAGLNAREIRAGALKVLSQTLEATKPEDSEPARGAALAVALARHRGVGMSVLMPYSDRLAKLAFWYRQLWAESLGKNGQGTMPVPALGAVDQHSQLQLYLDGPGGALHTLILPDSRGRGPVVNATMAAIGNDIDWLADRPLGDLLAAEGQATADTLIRRGRPVRLMRTGPLNESVLGGLLMHFMLETILTAHVLGVDPFDQPAVEEGKVLARQYMAETRGE